MNKVVHFLLTLLIMFAVSIAPAQALLKGGTWQELNSTTGAVNGTAPLADGATIPLYQGSMLLDPTKTYDIEFTAMPRDFSADASSTSMRAVNSTDTEGDLFTDPPSIAWENQEPPTMSLVWADAATPDTPLSPQPILNQTFCAQNLAGRQLVAWAQVEDENSVPALWLYTRTGVPNSAVIPLLSPKVTLNIKPAVSDPVSVSGDHIDANFAASKVKAGESITLTVSTKACNGDVAPNAAFVIRREDAINRQGVVNNANPVRVGDTELTTTQTEYHGVTDGQGNATVVVTQEQGPGVKTRLIVSSQSYPTLTDNVDVIFTTITSPDSDKANMYGHMLENATATLNGTTYTFTRPKLAAETSGNGGTVVDTNETWAQFTWSGADNHCDILPDAEQLVALRHEHSALATYTGWPVTGDAEYWSSTKDQINDYHAAVHMNSASVVRAANSDTLLVSCVDKAQPAAHPQMTLSPEGPYKAQVGESIDLVMTVVDRDTQKPLPYRYMELFIDPAKNRKGEHQDAWDNQRVTINTEDMRASSPEHYTGVTDANGQVHLTLKHDSGLGVETPIRIVMPDDEGGSIELPFSVIFTVITSPDVDGANMWGHMQGVVDAGNLYKRPLLAVAKTGEAIPMTVTVTNGAGQPQAGATVMLTRDYSYSRGTVDSKYIQAGVIGEPVASKGALSDMTLTPVSPAGAAAVFSNQRGTSTKWYGATGDDGKLRFTLNQDKSLGLRTSITATLSELAGETASVDAIFTVPASPDTPYASYWGHMPDTVEVNGVTLRRPFLKTEMSKMPPGTWPLNNETWAANYIDYGETSIHATTSLPYLCGSLENAATLDDLKALKNIIGDLHWPTAAPASSYTYDYASQTMVGGKYCSFNETTNTENCTLSSQGFAYASCRVQ